MKKLCLLLAVIVTAAFGCSEDKKVNNNQNISKANNFTNADELITAVINKFNAYNYQYPTLNVLQSKTYLIAKNKLVDEMFLVTISQDKLNNKSLSFSKKRNSILFFAKSKNKIWKLFPKQELKTTTKTKIFESPSLMSCPSLKVFKSSFKNIKLMPELTTIDNEKCYKLVCRVDKNNPLQEEFDVFYWVTKKNLLPIKLQTQVIIQGVKYKGTSYYYSKIVDKKYQLQKIIMISEPFDKNYLAFKNIITIKKIVHGAPFDETLLKRPKDKNDYKKLQDYFNNLLSKYYDNKYQIKIK